MGWLFTLLQLLASTTVELLKAQQRGATATELAAISAESIAAQGALLAEQQRTLREIEDSGAVPGFHVKGA